MVHHGVLRRCFDSVHRGNFLVFFFCSRSALWWWIDCVKSSFSGEIDDLIDSESGVCTARLSLTASATGSFLVAKTRSVSKTRTGSGGLQAKSQRKASA